DAFAGTESRCITASCSSMLAAKRTRQTAAAVHGSTCFHDHESGNDFGFVETIDMSRASLASGPLDPAMRERITGDRSVHDSARLTTVRRRPGSARGLRAHDPKPKRANRFSKPSDGGAK